MVGIAPKKHSKTDFFGCDEYYYIVRSDLNCYMKSSDFHAGNDLDIYSLHPSCRGGDHYLAYDHDMYYVIKGNCYRRVANLNTDEDSVVATLHPNCRGGDHYLSAYGYFYVIYQSRGVYRRCKSMNTDEEGVEFPLHPNCRNGIYYFGRKGIYYFVQPYDRWGMQYVKVKDYETNEGRETYSFHPSVINFLPGDLSISKGPSYGEWVCIKTISNDSQTPVTWTKRITKKVGYEREKMSSIEHNWKVSATVSAETGGLTDLIAKSQFSLTTEYGGSSVNTEKENWSEATEIEETITTTLQPQQKIYIWTYQLGMGKTPVLYCRDVRILDNPSPPTDVPLPPAVN